MLTHYFKHEHPCHTSGFLFFSIGDYHRTLTNRQPQKLHQHQFPWPSFPNPENSSYIHRRVLVTSLKEGWTRTTTEHKQPPPHLSQNTTATFFALIDRWQPHTRARTSLTKPAVGIRLESLNGRRGWGEVAVQLWGGRYKFHSIPDKKKTNLAICAVILTSATTMQIAARRMSAKHELPTAAHHTLVH